MRKLFSTLILCALNLCSVAQAADSLIYIAKNSEMPYATAEEAADAYFEHGKTTLLPTSNARCWRHYYELSPYKGAYRDMKVVNGRQIFGCQWPAPGGNTADLTDRIAFAKNCATSADERCGFVGARANVKNAGIPDCDGSVLCGNPFNLGTGNKVQVDTDFTVPGSPLLTFQRTYNSSHFAIPGTAVSRRWRHSFEYFLKEKSNGLVELHRPNGNAITFQGLFPVSPDETGKLRTILDAQGAIAEWSYTAADGVVEKYDVFGRVTQISQPQGGYVIIKYSGESMRPTEITDNFGRKISFQYSGYFLLSVTTPDNKVYSYGYNTNKRLSSVTAPDGTARKYEYDLSTRKPNPYLWEQLTGIFDESNTKIADFYYNKNGQMVRNERASGTNRVNVTKYVQAETVVQATTGALETYTFATIQGHEKATIKKTSCPDGSCSTTVEYMGYDTNGNLSSYVDAAGNKTCINYDLVRNLPLRKVEGLSDTVDCSTALENPAVYGMSRTFDTLWHAAFRLPLASSGPLLRTEYLYDDHQRVLQQTQTATSDATGAQGLTAGSVGMPRTVSYTYNAAGQILSEDGPRTDVQDVTSYTYDGSGNLITITNPLGQVTRYDGYDGAGRPGTVTYPNGRIQSLTYDAKGRVTRVDEGGEATVFVYTPTGLLSQVTLPSGVQLQYGYDTAQRLIKLQDDRGSRIDYVRDVYGNITSQKAFGPNATVAERQASAVFDVLGRLKQATGAL